mmetsp:Transcript_79623/g.231151  ORF Transcript_79623/g.231151 Transcript_79623/m.231151 type:complete len:426 (-) Transcript_79623:2-1279(-)
MPLLLAVPELQLDEVDGIAERRANLLHNAYDFAGLREVPRNGHVVLGTPGLVLEPRVGLAPLDAQAVVRVDRQQSLDERPPFVGGRQPRLRGPQGRDDSLVHLGLLAVRRLDLERPHSAEHGVHHHAEAPQVRPLVIDLLDDLRRDEVGRADDRETLGHFRHARHGDRRGELLGRRRRPDVLGEAEVANLNVVQVANRPLFRFSDEDVLQLQIPVDHVLRVHVRDAVEQLLCDVPRGHLAAAQPLKRWHPRVAHLVLDSPMQIAASREVQDQEAAPALPKGAQHVHDPRVVQLAHVPNLEAQVLPVLLRKVEPLDVDDLHRVLVRGVGSGALMDGSLAALPQALAEAEAVVGRAEVHAGDDIVRDARLALHHPRRLALACLRQRNGGHRRGGAMHGGAAIAGLLRGHGDERALLGHGRKTPCSSS